MINGVGVLINNSNNISSYKIKPGVSMINAVKNIIAITSGKGGVGKSTLAINISASLAKMGYKVGLLDCDIYGPSIPTMVGEEYFKPDVQNEKFVPLVKYGLQILSFGFLINKNQPAIWRGAIVIKALMQMLNETAWDNLDFLILDMPPGTGDIQLTLAQKIPITGTVIVTTPQDVSLNDVIKSIEMYKKLDITNLGFIENMSYHICENCGNHTHIFKSGATAKIIHDYKFKLLGNIPLNSKICEQSDKGIPIIISDNSINKLYEDICINLINNLKLLPVNYSQKLSTIKIVKK